MDRRRWIGWDVGVFMAGDAGCSPRQGLPPGTVGVCNVPMEAQVRPRQAHPSFLASVLGNSVPQDSCPPFGYGVFADVIKVMK